MQVGALDRHPLVPAERELEPVGPLAGLGHVLQLPRRVRAAAAHHVLPGMLPEDRGAQPVARFLGPGPHLLRHLVEGQRRAHVVQGGRELVAHAFVERLQERVGHAAERQRRGLLLRFGGLLEPEHALHQEEERTAPVELELARRPAPVGSEALGQVVQHHRVPQPAMPGIGAGGHLLR